MFSIGLDEINVNRIQCQTRCHDIFCDNLSATNISKNPIQHSRTKHIDIRYHFIKELVEEKIVALEHVATELQLADIFTKAMDATQFENLRRKLEIFLYEGL